MKTAIRNREILTFSVQGLCLRGTYHRCPDTAAPRRGVASGRNAVLFLNPGFQPRAASGDSAVEWADAFAQCGYPSFRVDLPGLGDSDGEIPSDMLAFVNGGGYAPVVVGLMKSLVQQFRFSGFVVVGLCAGAVTAIYSGASSEHCKGVVLMDPYFFQTNDLRPTIRVRLTRWASWSRLGAAIGDLYDGLRSFRLHLLGKRLPNNANVPLLRSWKKLESAGAPILVLKAPGHKDRGTKPRTGEFDYLRYLQASAGRKARIAIHFLTGTNHSFADSIGRSAVRQHTLAWLNTYFPLFEYDEAAVVNGF